MKRFRNSIFIVCGLAVIAFLLLWNADIYSFTAQGTLRSKSLGNLKNASVVSRLNYNWCAVYVLDTPKEYKTILSERQGLLWHFAGQWYVDKTSDPVQSIGWAGWSDNKHQITVMVVKNTDPRVTQIEQVSPMSITVIKPISTTQPLVLSWNTSNIFGNGMELYALSKSGKKLYQYGVQQKGNVIHSGSRWYLITN